MPMPAAYMYPQQYAYVQPLYIVPGSSPWQTYQQQSQPTATGSYLTGRLKFFDEIQQYGFFILDTDGTDLFVHYDDLLKSGITLSALQGARMYDYRFIFQCMTYYGKYSLSRKAVNVRILNQAQGVSSEYKYAAFADYSSKASGI